MREFFSIGKTSSTNMVIPDTFGVMTSGMGTSTLIKIMTRHDFLGFLKGVFCEDGC